MLSKVCPVCNKKFNTNIPNKKYCSLLCANTFDGRKSPFKFSTATVGTISELEVATDLLKKGYEVYRPLSASCSGDFLIQKNNGEFLKIEVRTGYKNENTGYLCFSPSNIRASIVAVVILKTCEIIYLKFPSKEKIIL